MRVLLVAVNAKYIHTSLSVRSLKAYASDYDVDFMEFTINENPGEVLKRIYRYGADMVAFSCYIWNIGFILRIASSLKKIAPNVKIIFGGPEVSFDSEIYMNKYRFIDAVIRGEGEETLCGLLDKGFHIDGVTYRDKDGNLIKMKDRGPICDLNTIPFPYTENDIHENRNKLIYYESSRGCPFRCSYCLSSTVHNVRFRNLETVKRELKAFIDQGCRIIKFVDRTFNADRKRAAELIEFLILEGKATQFHFEIAADLINDEMIRLFRSAPKDMFLLEIGVQSTNKNTIAEIDRKTDFERISSAVKALKGSVHMHLDLIVGLPYENYESFKRSFNDVMELEPDVLQLGFLKLLRGTKIRDLKEKHGYIFEDDPPYEVLGNKYISYEEILKLKSIEYVLDRYYNSEIFQNSIRYLIKRYHSPYEMFESLAGFFEERGLFSIGISQSGLFGYLAEFCEDELFRDYLKLDYFMNTNNPSTPSWSNERFDRTLLKKRFDILTEDFIKTHLPEYSDMPVKEIIKRISIERFSYDVLKDGRRYENILIFDKTHDRIIRTV